MGQIEAKLIKFRGYTEEDSEKAPLPDHDYCAVTPTAVEMGLLDKTKNKDYSTIKSDYESDAPSEPGTPGSTSSHCHDLHKPASGPDKRARRKLIIASILCLAFTIGEAVGGAVAGSLAIMTDASHMLTDFASFMISLFALFLASRPATKKWSWGWHRAEILGAVTSVLMIWVLTGVLVYLAVERCIKQDYEIDAKVMLITAAVGVAVNLVLACTLGADHGHSHGLGGGHGHSHGGGSSPTTSSVASLNDEERSIGGLEDEKESDGHGHSHGSGEGHGHSHGNGEGHGHSHGNGEGQGHGHSHGGDKKHEHHKENINVRAAFVHVIGDLLQSIGVLTAAFIIYFKPEWKLADPICTFIFSVLVLITTITILRDAVRVLMEGTPVGLDYSTVKKQLKGIRGVKEVHNLHIWSLTLSKTALSVHLAIDQSKTNYARVLKTASKICSELGIHEPTIQIEPYHDDMDDCDRCQDPDTD